MIVAVCAQEPSPQSPVDARFGRCACFALTGDEGQNWTILDNPYRDAAGGAGVQAAQLLVQQGVEVLLAEELGPKAAAVLEAANVQVYQGLGGTVEESFQAYARQQLRPMHDRGRSPQGVGGMGRQRRFGGRGGRS